MKETLNNQVKKPIALQVIIKLLYLILTLNNFVFNGIIYLQKKGCGMGKICIPVYANIFMGKFEKLNIYPTIFLLLNGTESELIKFTDNLNQKHLSIKFEFTYSRISITFLDTKVCENENTRTLCTTINRKPSYHCNFLHHKSVHPKAMKDSIPYSQALHIKRICSDT